jgi:histidinol-phosphate aminotransferase
LQWKVKEKLAEIKGVKPQQIFLGNGSDEAIDLLIRAFCEPNVDSVLITPPTYGMYAVCADVNAVGIEQLPLTPDFDIDLNTFPKTFKSTTKILFLCSPNNPSGNLLSRDKVIEVINRFPGLVVVDEAYIDFTASKSFALELSNYSNLIILQTFSKAWGLAGLRLGMCFASEEIIGILNKIKYPYNVNIFTQEQALKTLAEVDTKNKNVKEIIQQRNILANSLTELSIVKKIYPSDANFLLVQVSNAPYTYEYLMQKGIIVRDRSKVTLCDNCIRITIGTPKENQDLLNALKSL